MYYKMYVSSSSLRCIQINKKRLSFILFNYAFVFCYMLLMEALSLPFSASYSIYCHPQYQELVVDVMQYWMLLYIQKKSCLNSKLKGLEQGWWTFLRACAQIFDNFRRNSFVCPWEFWTAKWDLTVFLHHY
jgi:hypothetical protein